MTEHVLDSSLVLEADLGPMAVAGLHAALSGRRGQALIVDARNVGHLGGGCLQLLLSAKLTWASDDQSFSLVSPSESMTRTLEFTGLGKAFSEKQGATQ